MLEQTKTPVVVYDRNANPSPLYELKLYDLFKDNAFMVHYQEIKNSTDMKKIEEAIHNKILTANIDEDATDIIDILLRYHIYKSFYEEQTITLEQRKQIYNTSSYSGISELLNIYSRIKQIEGSSPKYIPSKITNTTGTSNQEQKTPICFGIIIDFEDIYSVNNGNLVFLKDESVRSLIGCASLDRDDPQEITKLSLRYVAGECSEENEYSITIKDLCAHPLDGLCYFRSESKVNTNIKLTARELHEIIKDKLSNLTVRYKNECEEIKNIADKRIKKIFNNDGDKGIPYNY